MGASSPDLPELPKGVDRVESIYSPLSTD